MTRFSQRGTSSQHDVFIELTSLLFVEASDTSVALVFIANTTSLPSICTFPTKEWKWQLAIDIVHVAPDTSSLSHLIVIFFVSCLVYIYMRKKHQLSPFSWSFLHRHPTKRRQLRSSKDDKGEKCSQNTLPGLPGTCTCSWKALLYPLTLTI